MSWHVFCDASGRVARDRNADGRFLVGAAVAIPSSRCEEMRNALASLPKWSKSGPEAAARVVDILDSFPEWFCALGILDSHEPWWLPSWAQAEALTQIGRSQPGGNELSFTKADFLVRAFLLSMPIGPAAGELVKRRAFPQVLDLNERIVARLQVTVDADIQGAENIEAFQDFFTRRFPAVRQLGYELTFGAVEIKNIRSEPLLLIPDLLAGAERTTRHPERNPERTGQARRLLEQCRERIVSRMSFPVLNVDSLAAATFAGSPDSARLLADYADERDRLLDSYRRSS